MHTEPAPDAAYVRPKGLALAAATLAAGCVGLVATLTLSLTLGWALLGRRDSWHEGQGEGFVTTVFAIYAAPVGALYWALAFAFDRCTLAARIGRVARRRALALAVGVYVLGLVGGFLVTVGAH